MHKAVLFFIIFMSTLNLNSQNIISIIPEPLEINQGSGFFVLDNNTRVKSNGEQTKNSFNFLNDYLTKYYNVELENNKKVSKTIELLIENNNNYKQGAYKIKVEPKKIVITGFNEQGLFYGVQSLIQLLPPQNNGQINIPVVDIFDEPRFEYRGMHLDVVRHIFPVDYIKKYIDYIALHKMNHFHWHLTDDQGWRMESKSHPILNEKGAYREGTIIGLFPGTGVDSTRYGGYYTIEQMKEIVDYASKRYITIVPEIDIPGHCMAVLAAYPEFGTEPERDVKPAITWGIFNRQNNVLAPSEKVFSFLEDVFNELMDVFPGQYIHMGADECAHKWWKESPMVQNYIQKNNLKDEKGLQKHFAEKVAKVITKRGRTPIGWDEMIDNGLVDDVIVMSWRNSRNAYRASAKGHKAILTPSPMSYFNVQQREKDDSVCHNTRVVSLDKVYKFEPLPDTLSIKQKENIIGGQGCMWTEYFPNTSKLEYGIFPRMSAIAEVYWSEPSVKSWPKFLLKLPNQFDRYDLWGANYSDIVFEHEFFRRK